jgi:DNA replication protein DnaC
MLSSTLLNELGYLPLDKRGAELLFQVISKRYEHGSMIITTNIAFKDWPCIFAGDATPGKRCRDLGPCIAKPDAFRSSQRS